jgi:hypothetical protein
MATGQRWCPERDSNPHAPQRAADFKSAASTDFAIRAAVGRRDYGHGSQDKGLPKEPFAAMLEARSGVEPD